MAIVQLRRAIQWAPIGLGILHFRLELLAGCHGCCAPRPGHLGERSSFLDLQQLRQGQGQQHVVPGAVAVQGARGASGTVMTGMAGRGGFRAISCAAVLLEPSCWICMAWLAVQLRQWGQAGRSSTQCRPDGCCLRACVPALPF